MSGLPAAAAATLTSMAAVTGVGGGSNSSAAAVAAAASAASGSSDCGGGGSNGGGSGLSGIGGYDWNSDENRGKWKGLLLHPLAKVLRLQSEQLVPEQEALDHVESLLFKLLAILTARPSPMSIAEVEDRVNRTFSGGGCPQTPLNVSTLGYAQDRLDRGKRKANLVFPVDKVHALLKNDVLQQRIDETVSFFLLAILEYIAHEILRVTVEFVTNLPHNHNRITCQDIKVAMCADPLLMNLFHSDGTDGVHSYLDLEDPVMGGPMHGGFAGHGLVMSRFTWDQTYDQVVKELIADEKQYLRDLHMITKVFRHIVRRHNLSVSQEEMESIFSNVMDVMELTMTLIGSLEDTLEMTEEDHGSTPAVGYCFEEQAENEEFDVYDKFTTDILSPNFRSSLNGLLSRPETKRVLKEQYPGYRKAFKYYLPMLLLKPVYHCFHYFKCIEKLMALSPALEESKILGQVLSLLTPLQKKVEHELKEAGPWAKRKPSDIIHRLGPNRLCQQSLQKLKQIQQSLINWEGKDITRDSSELIQEGNLKVLTDNKKRFADRHVFLFDKILIICKQALMPRWVASAGIGGGGSGIAGTGIGPGSGTSGAHPKYTVREKYLLRRLDVEDNVDPGSLADPSAYSNEELRLMFEIVPWGESSGAQRVVIKADNLEEKQAWMASLVTITTKQMLENDLDAKLKEEEKCHPLRFPPKHIYEFSEPDSDQNIVFVTEEGNGGGGSNAAASNAAAANEEGGGGNSGGGKVRHLTHGGVPLIKGATLIKLVERLTYNFCADPMFRNTFLITYRTFCTPHELLDLLIKRFKIPKPEAWLSSSSDSESDSEMGEKTSKIRIAQDLKRFQKEYSQPVQLRVLNVLKHWVDQHFYDFQQDENLLANLEEFLEKGCQGKSMSKWVDAINKKIQLRKGFADNRAITYDFDRSKPYVEMHIENVANNEGWPELLTYHPLEIARQLTLLEFEYYRAVKSSELVDQAWMSKEREERSPNLLRVIRHINHLTWYLSKLIVETENFEERVAVYQRILEIMVALRDLNNFNGLIAISSVLHSSPIHRLGATRERMPNFLVKVLEDVETYVHNHCAVYLKRLRSINPPCVPFLGTYQSTIKFTEDGNDDFLRCNQNLINFSKRRMVANIISEIQQYQNQPYCLKDYPELKAFLANLDPFPGQSSQEVADYLWARSIDIEPSKVAGTDQPRKKPKEAERKWKNLNLKSPGIKLQKHQLPSIKATFRHATVDDSDSPATSPNLRPTPPHSLPSTPNNALPPPTSPPEKDPRMMRVDLPTNGSQKMAPPPPPLPPKAPKAPPLPPRSSNLSRPAPPLESRSPLMDPVVHRRNSSLDHHHSHHHHTAAAAAPSSSSLAHQSPPAVGSTCPPPAAGGNGGLPRRHSAAASNGIRAPPVAPLIWRDGSHTAGSAAQKSPGWGQGSIGGSNMALAGPSPSTTSTPLSARSNGPPSGGSCSAAGQQKQSAAAAAPASSISHFTFSQHHVMESQSQQANLAPMAPPRPPPTAAAASSLHSSRHATAIPSNLTAPATGEEGEGSSSHQQPSSGGGQLPPPPPRGQPLNTVFSWDFQR